ncbi:MAG TPA: TonB-dependent receptor plug domain-containing protein, partial [Pedobacter sp.]
MTVKVNDDLRKITLLVAAGQLDQVEAIGYGTTTKRLNTGNVSTVSAEVIANQPVTNVMQALEGRVPGMFVKQQNGLPGSGMNVQIRGRNSITASNSPLYIIDGVSYPSDFGLSAITTF